MSVPIRTKPVAHDRMNRTHRRAAMRRIIVRGMVLVLLIGGAYWLIASWVASRTPLVVPATEHDVFGVWCREEICRYFDQEGAFWGDAVPSRGPLMLFVQDDRSHDEASAQIAQAIALVADQLTDLGVRAQSAELPNAAPGDLTIFTDKSYKLLFDVYGDVSDQVATLGVLLAESAKNDSWAPISIDLRTPGRVYYR